MPRLSINGTGLEVAPGTTLLEAAEAAGVRVPTLCHARGVAPLTSCMICVVEEKQSGRRLPACSAKAEEGMDIETDTPAIHAARREVLQLLMSEHAGDCEAPCRRMCPAGLDIPLMLRLIAAGEKAAAAQLALRDLVIPATLGWVCRAPCERGCRRGVLDEAIAIRDLHRNMAETALPSAPGTGKRIAVIGAGAAGLAAAGKLRSLGHACCVYEKEKSAGGSLRTLSEEELPKAVLDGEIARLGGQGINFRLGNAVTSIAQITGEYDAVVVCSKNSLEESEGIFAAKAETMAVRAVAAGKLAAETAHRFVLAEKDAPRKDYDSSLGRIDAEGIAAYATNRLSTEALARPRQPDQPKAEAERCLHCDCHAAVSCKLRQYATEYGATPNVYYSAARGPVETIKHHGGILFEAGKCIKCGLCVEITRAAGEDLGLTFVGRGFNLRVTVPFEGPLAAALQKCAQAVVAACPTGALAFTTQEERKP